MDLLSPVPDHEPVQFSVLFQSVTIWGNDEMRWWENRAGWGWGGWKQPRWMEGMRKQINLFKRYLQRVESLLKTWANVNGREGETDGQGGGRKRGENIWHTGGGGGGACESLEDEERRGGNKTGEGEEADRAEKRRTSLFRFCEDAGNEVLLLSPPGKLHFHLFFPLSVPPDFSWILASVTCWASSAV